MKQVSDELREHLHSRKEFLKCDLYELTLQSGLIFRYANYDMNITLPDGRVFFYRGPQFKRERTKLSSEITVDKMNVNVLVDQTDKIGNAPMLHIAHNGGFDDAQLSVYKCFVDTPGVVVGTVEMFTGDINVKDGGGIEMNWEVKSKVQKLNVDYPLGKYYPTCPYSLYDAGCGLNVEDYTIYGTVTIQNGYQSFYTNIPLVNGYYDQGGIEFLTGDLVGVSAPIKWSGVNEISTGITMMIPLNAMPAVGDTFKMYPGCNKTPEQCKSRFNNFIHNRATPFIPMKEAII